MPRQKLELIGDEEWLYFGCFIQKSQHPELYGNYEVFKNNEEQTHVDRCKTFKEAKALCIKNKCDDHYLTFGQEVLKDIPAPIYAPFTYTSFKERKIDPEKAVKIYRCLNRKGHIFSIKQGDLVVGHTDNIVLKDCWFKVNKYGKQKAIETGIRNVHAFVIGRITNNIESDAMYDLKYNPFSDNGFYTEEHGKAVYSPKMIIKNGTIKIEVEL